MKKDSIGFVWNAALAHTIAYFIAGIFAVTFLGYRERFAEEALATFMRQVDDPMTALGPGLQILRGLVVGAVLLPFRKRITGEKHGYAALALLVAGLSGFSALGPAPGSFEGFVYTTLSPLYHVFGLPELVLYVLLFALVCKLLVEAKKKAVKAAAVATVVLISLLSLLGYLAATGVLAVPA